jgi:hypothetical protein
MNNKTIKIKKINKGGQSRGSSCFIGWLVQDFEGDGQSVRHGM